MTKKYFEIDSNKIVYERVTEEFSDYKKNGDTLFLKNVLTRADDTLIIQIMSNDTAVVKNRHGGEDFFIVRTTD